MYYVLTIFNDGVLESCDIFFNVDDAFYSGTYYCDYNNIEKFDINTNNYDPSMEGWIIADKFPYFISVVKRPALSDRKESFSSRHRFNNTVRMSDKFAIPRGPQNWTIGDPLPYFYTHNIVTAPSKFVAPLNLIPVSPPPPTPVDDPEDPTLPGGFDFSDKPIYLDDISIDPYNVKDTHELTDNQQWGLVLARAKKRPHMIWGTLSQSQIVEELTKRTANGHQIKNIELLDLQYFYDKARAADNSSAQEYEDSSSSEQEDEDLD